MSNNKKHKFKIGTKFKTRGKHPRLCTVIDQLTTYNSTGDIVKIRYVATHSFMGQILTNYDVVEAAISMGIQYEENNSVGESWEITNQYQTLSII